MNEKNEDYVLRAEEADRFANFANLEKERKDSNGSSMDTLADIIETFGHSFRCLADADLAIGKKCEGQIAYSSAVLKLKKYIRDRKIVLDEKVGKAIDEQPDRLTYGLVIAETMKQNRERIEGYDTGCSRNWGRG